MTHSIRARSGSMISKCKRLPELQGTPCHRTLDPESSENRGQCLQSAKTFQATAHWALVKTIWSMRTRSDGPSDTGNSRVRPVSGRDKSDIVVRNTFP